MSCEHKPVQREVLRNREPYIFAIRTGRGRWHEFPEARPSIPGTGIKVWVCELCGESLYEVPA